MPFFYLLYSLSFTLLFQLKLNLPLNVGCRSADDGFKSARFGFPLLFGVVVER